MATGCTLAATGKCASATLSRYRSGCREKPCQAANALYKKDLRVRSVAERTKTRVNKSSNVVEMPARTVKTDASKVAAPNVEIVGTVERSVIDRFAALEIDNPALVESCKVLARLLDDQNARGSWVAATKQLHAMLERAAPTKKKKSNTGKLAIMNSMGQPRRRTGT
jgi:hypothetical protein